MKPFFQITLATGHVYEVPAAVIAENRAKVMLELRTDEFKTIEEAMTDTVEMFDDAYEVVDWAKSNMNPEDYLPKARLIRFNQPERDFTNAEWSAADSAAMMGEMEAGQIMSSPVDYVLSVMSASGQACNVTVMSDHQTREPFAAVAVILGCEKIIGSYVETLQMVTQVLASKPTNAPTH